MDAFFTTEGLHAVVNQISLLVQLPISETLGFEESSLLNSHLRFIDRLLLSHGGDDRLRNLVEGNLFKSLKLIFEKSSLFPQESFSYSISILSNFVHNEPTSLSFLQEQGVPQAFLHAVTQYPKLPPQSELFLRLPQAFSAICLNSLGVQQFLEMNPMSRLFEPFLDPETYLKCMKSHMTSSEYGRAIDEFMRHQPKFRDDAIKAMIETIKSYPALLQRYQAQVKANGNVGYQLVEIGSSLKEISMIPLSEAIEKMKKPESNPAINMLDNFTMTIEGILQSPTHSKEFIDAGGIDCLLDVYSSPGFGYDFTARQESFSISHIFRLISENDSNGNNNESDNLGAASVLLSVWKHVFRCSESIEHSFLARTDGTSIFGQLLKGNLDVPTLAQLDSLFQPLCSLLAILGLLGDLYIQHSFTFTRSAGIVVKGLASTPEGGAAIHFLSLLLGSTIWEHHLFDLEIPSSHLKAFSKLHQIISSQYGPNPFKAQMDPNEHCPDPDDPRVKNTFACRFLTEKIPSSIMAIFGGLSRMLSGRRSNLDLENSDILKVSSMLANSIANNLESLHMRQPSSMTECNFLHPPKFFLSLYRESYVIDFQ
jgi:E3 ubiquitin-protein ligase HUWE1